MNFGRETFRERSNATIVSPNEYWTHLGRSNVTVVSPNASWTLKRYYNKSKSILDAQTLL